ncbi:MAG: hypothetical protein G8237_10055 [Magnetococcales bacterium]|nr:acylphosphatase [Magnetococcales bacterium]NGZ06687.1 hypothetical protein [Magnetococcales bacterium]
MIPSSTVSATIQKAIRKLALLHVPPERARILLLAHIDAAPLSPAEQAVLVELIVASSISMVATYGNYVQFENLRRLLPQLLVGPHFHSGQAVEQCVEMLRRTDEIVAVVMMKQPGVSAVSAPVQSSLPVARSDPEKGRGAEGRPVFVSTANQALIQAVRATRENDFTSSPYLQKMQTDRLTRSALNWRLFQDAAKKRNRKIRVEKVESGKTVIMYPCRHHEVIFDHSPDLSVVAARIVEDKALTKEVLSRNGILVPTGAAFDNGVRAKKYFLNRRVPQVVKPVGSARGRGVAINITSDVAFDQAWARARRFGKEVIVEDFFDGDLVRIMVLGGRVLSALCITPAYVEGDGVSTIAALIEQKNRLRQSNPATWDTWIRHAKLDQLRRDGRSLQEISAVGSLVRLTVRPVVDAGGDVINIIDKLHRSICELAARIFRIIPGATLLGIDLLINDFSAAVGPENVRVLGLHALPVLSTSVFPAAGPVPAGLIDALFIYAGQGRHETAGVRHAGQPEIGLIPIIHRSQAEECFGLKIGTRELLMRAAMARNLQMERFSKNVIIYHRDGKQVGFNMGMPSCTRLLARCASNHKAWTKRLLREQGIPTPEGREFATNAMHDAWKYTAELGSSIVVKPVYGKGGKGVTTRIASHTHFIMAWEVAVQAGAHSIMVEKCQHGHDYRVIVIGNRLCAVTQRVPAHVVGDGEHTIEQLIAIKNEQRRTNPLDAMRLIELTPMIRCNLAEVGVYPDTVPLYGQRVSLHFVANGGDNHDVSDQVHPQFAKIAVRVRQAIYNPFHVGFDLIAEDIAKSPDEQSWSVIEVNTSPDLRMQHFPTYGPARDLAGALLDELFPETCRAEIPRKVQRVEIVGHVQGVGFRRWVWKRAHFCAVQGWVRNRSDGQVEALFSGSVMAVNQMIVWCRQGPTAAKVKQVLLFEWGGEIPADFQIADQAC